MLCPCGSYLLIYLLWCVMSEWVSELWEWDVDCSGGKATQREEKKIEERKSEREIKDRGLNFKTEFKFMCMT